MPILSVFIVGLMFRHVDARAAIAGLVVGLVLYGVHNFILYQPGVVWPVVTVYQHLGLDWLHYIDVMLLVLVVSVSVALGVNRWVFGNRAELDLSLLRP